MKQLNKKAVIGLDNIKAVIMILLVLGVIAIALFLTVTSLTSVMPSIETSVSSNAIAGGAQTLLTVNGTTGATLTTCNNYIGGSLVEITAQGNATKTAIVLTAENYTLSGCIVKGVAGQDFINTRWNVTAYTFQYKKASQEVSGISNNITGGTTNLFAQIPTIFSILGISIIIAAITIIIIYVQRFEGGGRESGL